MNAKGIGFCTLMILVAPLTSFGSEYFDDDLETIFGFYTNDNISWSVITGGAEIPCQCDTMATTGVSCETATTGTTCEANSPSRSLRFNFPAGATSQSSQFMNLQPSSGGMSEVWVEWYQMFPSTWSHTDHPTLADDNQFFQLSGTDIALETYFEFDASGDEIVRAKNLTGPGGALTLTDDTGPGVLPLPVPNDWRRMRWHVKADAANGIFNHWIDSDQILDNTGASLATSAETFNSARIMGFANSGYASLSHTYLDDIFVSNRPPVSILLVLDRSGSMANATTTGGLTKIEALKKSASVFLDLVSGYAGPRDRIGVTTFSNTSVMLNQSGATVTKDLVLTDAAVSANTTDLKNNVITPLTAGGATSIGDALLDALAVFEDDTNPHQIALLFTDGKQNTSPLVDDTTLGADFQEGGVDINDALTTRIEPTPTGPFHADNHLQICLVSVGLSPAVDTVFNSRLSQCQNRDYTSIDTFGSDFVCTATDPACTDLVNDFVTNLQNAVVGDRVETSAIENNGTQFLVNRQDVRISIVLLWSDAEVRAEALSVKLQTPQPGSIEIDASPFTKSGTGYQVISFPLPLPDRDNIRYAGEWRLAVELDDDVMDFDYSLIVMNDNRRLATRQRFVGSDFGTGETIPMELHLTEAGLPISGANVAVRVKGPNDSVGNVLCDNPTPDLTGGGISGDVLTPAAEKLQLLLDNPQIRDRLRQIVNPDIKLKDPDGDGVYTGNFTAATSPGTYRFEFMVDGNTTANGRFVRVLKQSLSVRAKPSTRKTGIDLQLLKESGDFNAILTFTPRDRLGNCLGPGFANLISVSGQGKLVGAAVDNLLGSYVLNLALTDISMKPDIRVSIGGDVVDLKDIRTVPWWLLLLLLLLIPILK